jgi:hypothetical protein
VPGRCLVRAEDLAGLGSGVQARASARLHESERRHRLQQGLHTPGMQQGSCSALLLLEACTLLQAAARQDA